MHDTRLLPAALVAWVGAWLCVVLGMRWHSPVIAGLITCAVVVIVPAVLFIRTASHVALVAVAIAVVVPLITALRVQQVTSGPLAQAAQHQAAITATATLAGDPQPMKQRAFRGRELPAKVRIAARVHSAQFRGQRYALAAPVTLIGGQRVLRTLLPGTTITVDALARPARTGERAAAVLDIREVAVVGQAPRYQRWAGTVRAGLREAVQHRPRDAAALLPSLSIGDTSLAPQSLVDDMRATGLSHLTVVSGANVSIVLAVMFAGLALVRIRGAVAVAAAFVGLVAFVVLARPDPSVLRAAVMGVVALIAIAQGLSRNLRGGGTRSLAALCVAIIVLIIWDPWLATSWGFALSVAATAGLVIAARPVSFWLRARVHHRLAPVTDAFTVTVVAQCAVAPVLLAMGGTVTAVSIPANMIVAPAVAPATISGLAAAAVSPLSPSLARWVALPGTWATGWIATVAHRAADVQIPRLWHSRWLPSTWQFLMCDVGQGAAFVVNTGQGHGLLFDSGPDPQKVDRCLHEAGVSVLDAIVLTHFHADHVDGLAGALRGRTVGTTYVSPLFSPPERAAVVQAISREVVIAQPGQRLQWAEVTVTFLWPRTWLDTESPENDHSVVSLLSIGARTVLITGDVETAAQSALAPVLPDVDVMTMPHHGSAKQNIRFAAAAAPEVVLVPVGANNDYGHPATSALELYAGARIGRTDTDGAVAVLADGTVVAQH